MLNRHKRKHNKITVKVYELSGVRDVPIDLTSGKDRNKLKHIILHEGYRLRKRDKERYMQLLDM